MSISKLSLSDKMFMLLVYLFVIAFTASIAYPLVYILSCSLSSPEAVMSGKVRLLPVSFSLDGYSTVFRFQGIWRSYVNSILYTSVGTLVNIVMTILTAYPLSRKDFFGRGFYTIVIVFTMFFSGGLIPTYLIVTQLGMRNTMWALVIPSAISVWNVIITRTFYQQTIPNELLEAARIDQCNDFRFLLHIVIPLSGAITAVNVLFYAVGHWNSYFSAMIYLTQEDKFPLQLTLRKILVLNSFTGRVSAAAMSLRIGMTELLKYSLIIIASAPMLVLYPFVQKYFVKGVMIGSLKG